jgi:uncharacterized membrane protein
MQPSPFHHLLYSWPILIVLGFVFALLIALIELNVLRYAYERMGVSRRYVFLLLFASLAGSYVNIPVAKVTEKHVEPRQFIRRYGVDYYLVPDVEQSSTTIAVNLGGAVIPTLLSIYLIIRNKLFLRGLIGVAIVTIIVHWLAYPVQGVGIAVPIFIPPIAAALVAVALAQIPIPESLASRGTVPFSSLSTGSDPEKVSGTESGLPRSSPGARTDSVPDTFSPLESVAPALAYVIGSLGTLIGADLLNLGNIQGLGAPIASIGGAGTFDGIFLTGILAVLLA